RNAEPKSIIEYAREIGNVLQSIQGNIDEDLVVKLEGSRLKPFELNASDIASLDLVSRISSIIIDLNRYDIRRFGKNKDPDENYEPAHTISVSISFRVKRSFTSFNVRMGGKSLSNAWVNQGGFSFFADGWDCALRIFRVIVDELDYDYAAVGSYKSQDIKEERFDEWLLNCTYFSNRGSHRIPPDMPGIDYHETDKGVYLSIGSKLCTSTDDPEYQEQKQIRLEATRRIKQANGLS